ncbi:unnamed protein product [Aphanomyces euteiches]|uniref:protein-tyrosine-phosphatase n=1 Tax=Aphanomyces euteiches TaxID=100861 RepID=A0A6G0WG57_9STRA|nr:hypothetical protein Ae201684_015671 [Aphanomyces euteiches]KAH9093470.1 hypothetical protein Ae201684P_016098 [Aphanomyces euteiches]KAH9145589.1 hypothetical protein AeRB84_010498 [Aphanomyces euteiches]
MDVAEFDTPGAILPTLYVGSAAHALNIILLHRHAITHLLCLDVAIPPRLVLPCTHVPMSPAPQDDSELALALKNCLPHIQAAIESRQVLLIFCSRGFNRAVAVSIAYLVSELHWTLRKAYRFLQERRRGFVLNTQYFIQLQDMEANLHEGECSLPDPTVEEQPVWRGLQTPDGDTTDDDESLQAPLTDTSSRGSEMHTLDRASVATNVSISTMRGKTKELENFYTKEEDDDDVEVSAPTVPQVPLVPPPKKRHRGGIPCCTQ